MIRGAKVSSTPSLRTVAMPADANANGDIFGGWLMSQMDLAGGVHAHQVAKGRTVTVAVDGMSFHLPVQIGDLVTCYCETVRIGRTSITIKVDTWVKRRSGGHEEKVTEGLFTFVAIDAEGNPRIIKGSSSG